MASFAPFRIRLWSNTGSNHGRGTVKAIIEDASDVGVSSYANRAGEMFFTIPMNHPQINELDPLESHLQVERYNRRTGAYDIIGKGILEDYEADKDEVVFYGIDYLGMLTKSITANNQSYSSTLIGTIINNQWTDYKAASNSPLGFIGTGLINVTSRTVTVVTSFEERLAFWRGLTEILQGAGSTRPILGMDITQDPPNFFFVANYGQDRDATRLIYGANVLDFNFSAGFTIRATTNRALGVKREGASVLYSTQTYGNPSTFSDLQMSALYTDIINQAELDSRALSDLRQSYDRSGSLYTSIAQGFFDYATPYTDWTLADSIPVRISRGIIDINNYYTIWGWEWIGRSNGSESVFLDVQPKMT